MTDTPTEREKEGAWARLRRRKVVQWGLAYVAAAWALLQGVDFLAEAFNWPNESRQLATIVFSIGLPIALVIAWYHGDRGEQRVGRAELAILTGMFALAGAVLWWYQSWLAEHAEIEDRLSADAGTGEAETRSIAVLPFVNTGPDGRQDHLADGIPGEILETLARTPGLYVPARGSSFQFAGQPEDLAVTAAQLRVANLLTGTVQRSGMNVRVVAQLIRASDGAILWSGVYEGPLEESVRVQKAIASQVLSTLNIPQAETAAGGRAAPSTSKPTAYDMYLEGRYLLETRTVDNVHRAVDLLREATLQDPSFAEAQSAFAVAALISRDYPSVQIAGYVPIAQAEQAAHRALEIDPAMAEPYAVLGMIAASRRDWSEAESRFLEAVATPGHKAMVNMWYGNFLRAVGRLDDANIRFREAWRLDPLSAVGLGNLAISFVSIGDTGAARELLKMADARGMKHGAISIAKIGIATNDSDSALLESALAEWFAFFPFWMPVGAESVLAAAVFDLASRTAAHQLLRDVIRDEQALESWGNQLIAALIGDFDTAFASAEHSSRQGGLGWGIAHWHPSVTEWRCDPRFKRVLRGLQLPEYWRRAGWPDACKPTSDDDFECTR